MTSQINQRRNFLKKCSLSTIPFLAPTIGLNGMSALEDQNEKGNKNDLPINFVYDGLSFSPQQYLEKLVAINQTQPIEPDFYGNGGTTTLLEAEFAKLTGKEKAIYLPTGTMANQLAIKLLNEHNTKVIVPENSHIFRDEADAAQSVHHKRLIPVGKDKPYFELADLENAINYIDKNEVFKSGLGTVVIENPIRRADGRTIPLETIKEISAYCKQQGYKMHLDGARIHLAAAYTKVPISEYAAYFDTVYISLYKYLNAAGGAILCGEARLIDQISHQIKIHGGTVFQNWNNTSVALHYLNGITERWTKTKQRGIELIAALNKIDSINITALKNGTNIHDLKLAPEINLKKLATFLYHEHQMLLGRTNDKGIIKFAINESLMTRSVQDIFTAWKKGIEINQK